MHDLIPYLPYLIKQLNKFSCIDAQRELRPNVGVSMKSYVLPKGEFFYLTYFSILNRSGFEDLEIGFCDLFSQNSPDMQLYFPQKQKWL